MAAGLAGIAIAAHRSLIAERETTLALAAAQGVFLLSLDTTQKDTPE